MGEGYVSSTLFCLALACLYRRELRVIILRGKRFLFLFFVFFFCFFFLEGGRGDMYVQLSFVLLWHISTGGRWLGVRTSALISAGTFLAGSSSALLRWEVRLGPHIFSPVLFKFICKKTADI